MHDVDAAVFDPDAVCPGVGLVPFDEDERVPRGPADPNAAKVEMDVGQQPIEPFIPSPRRRERASRSAQSVVSWEGMLELAGEGAQDRLGVAAVNGIEEVADAAADNSVIHRSATGSMIEPT